MPIGRFERYDTPHPKPFAPKNRANRNSGDLSNIVSNLAANEISNISVKSVQEVSK